MYEINTRGPAMVWDYIHAMRLFAIDVITGKLKPDVLSDTCRNKRDGSIEDSWAQWDHYTDINFWIDERSNEGIGIERVRRWQVATAYLHPTGDNEQKFECGDNLDDRCTIELYRERI